MRCFKKRTLFSKCWGMVLLGLANIICADEPAVRPASYAVASAHPLATNAGLTILAQGGNAFDAAVAVSAALAVVEPYHSGLGGGGFWLLHKANSKTDTFIDGREVAPLAAFRDMFLDKQGQPVPELSLNGGLAAAIPGEPAALVLIAQRFGRLPLKQSLAPAIQLAEKGFPVDHQLYHFLTMPDRLKQLQRYPASAAIFLRRDKPIPIGAYLVQRDLANTLRILAAKGHDVFYRGMVAKRLVKAVNRAGGNWRLEDLERYRAVIRAPLQGMYHGMHITTAPLPSGGGITLLTMLNIISEYRLSSLSTVQWVHYLVEAMRLAFWQRTQLLGDPAFVTVSVNEILSQQHTETLRRFILPDKATSNHDLPEQPMEPALHPNTTHFSILDSEGNRVSATLSVNFIFGSSVVAEGTGVLLNDEMDDFTIKPMVANVFGLVGGIHNVIAPGKRPLSDMTPTFLESPGRLAILGTPGGSRIPTMVLLAALVFERSYGAISMVSAMRFHHQYKPDWLQFEPDTFSPALQASLKKMGYHLMPLQQYYGDMQAITWDKKHNFVTAASDPRHIGLGVSVSDSPVGGYGVMH